MRKQAFVVAVVFAGLSFGVVAAGCSERAPDKPAPFQADVYAVTVQAAVPSSLPPCTSALTGTTAFAATPPSLWTCDGKKWMEIACATANAGAVAYASATNTL